jgi:protein-disulfide isomerase
MNHLGRRGVATWKPLVGVCVAVAAIWALSQVGRGTGQDQVLAVVGGQKITRGEVEGGNVQAFLQLDRQRHELLEQGLEEAIRQKLVEVEAESRGMTSEELLAQEVEQNLIEPSDAVVDSFYQARRISILKDSIAPRIRQFLQQGQRVEATQALLASLHEKYPVQNYLEPQRADVAATGPSKGPEDAPVTIVEFADFECPYCLQILPSLVRLEETYGDNVRMVFRQFPLSNIHRHAQDAAEASLCAYEQNKFWEMHDIMFEEQSALGIEALKEKAARLGLDSEQFDTCLDSNQYADQVAADFDAARRLGLTGTPAMFINGRFLSGAQPYDLIAKIVDDELRRAGL